MADQGGQGPFMSQNVNEQLSEMSPIANGHPGQGHPGHAHIRQPQPQTAQRQRPPVLEAATIGVPGENPAIDLESTDGSGNGSPVDAPSEPQQIARLDSSQGGFLSPYLNNNGRQSASSNMAEIGSLNPSTRPPIVSLVSRKILSTNWNLQPRFVDGTNDIVVGSPLPPDIVSIAGFSGTHAQDNLPPNVPVLVEYSALLRPKVPGDQRPSRFLVFDYSPSDALETMIYKIRIKLRDPDFLDNEREIVEQRVNYMRMEVAWLIGGSGGDVGHSILLDDAALAHNFAMMERRGWKDYFVIKVKQPYYNLGLDQLETPKEIYETDDKESKGKGEKLRANEHGSTETEHKTSNGAGTLAPMN